jgi:hypothetical protein
MVAFENTLLGKSCIGKWVFFEKSLIGEKRLLKKKKNGYWGYECTTTYPDPSPP